MTSTMPPPPPPMPPMGTEIQQGSAPKKPFWKRTGVLIGAGAIAVLSVVGAITPDSDAESSEPEPTPSAPAVVETERPDATPEPVEEVATVVETPAAAAVMPDVVGLDLQLAQDTIQEAGVFFSRSEDATGQGRMQIMDRNWVVVSQNPAPGSPIDEGDPLLSVVKDGESVEEAAAVVETPAAAAVMPDVVGLDLQLAQDTIQEAGVFFSRSEDATGQGRMQIMDRHWVVVGQEPAAGSPIGEGDALLYVVKDDEI